MRKGKVWDHIVVKKEVKNYKVNALSSDIRKTSNLILGAHSSCLRALHKPWTPVEVSPSNHTLPTPSSAAADCNVSTQEKSSGVIVTNLCDV